MTAFFQKLRQSEFRTEWCCVAVTILVDAIWARFIGFHLLLGWTSLLMIAAIAAAYGLVRGPCSARLGFLAEYFCLSLAGSAALLVFSYLSLASAPGPLADQKLLAADRALGFDWLSLYRALMEHGTLATVGKLIYDSLLGKSGALRLKGAQDWKRFELIRPVPESQEVTLSISLQGFGELLVDDVRIAVFELRPDAPTTPANRSAVEPVRFSPLDVRRLNPLQKKK